MTARSFGRKGISEESGGAIQSRRAAFLASERTLGDRAAETEVFPAPARHDLRREREAELPAMARAPIGPRSLKIAYALWLVLGIAGAHRLYLGLTKSGALQAAVCAGCLAATWMQYYEAFAGLAICWLWMFADGLRLKKMHAEAVGPDAPSPRDEPIPAA
ncbi:MAG TPA: TM2 domain-containing protein [Allosphingosinicella sp.]|nr:TM2 domain-containing protein [Allosphingosinicella sp.]